MKKRRRLANKMTIMVCAVLIAVSAFFYIPMDIHAASSYGDWHNVGSSGYDLSYDAGYLKFVTESNYDWEYYNRLLDGDSMEIRGQYTYRDSTNSININNLCSSTAIPLVTMNGSNLSSLNCSRYYLSVVFKVSPNIFLGNTSSLKNYDYNFGLTNANIIAYGKKYPCVVTPLADGYNVTFFGAIDSGLPTTPLSNTSLALELIGEFSGFIASDSSEYQWAQSTVWVSYDVTVSSGNYAVRIREIIDDVVSGSDVENQTNSLNQATQNQTNSLNQATQNQTNTMVNGFNADKGNDVNSDLSAGLDDYQTAEDSLWATATTGMKDFTFFDIQSVPAMVTGISFVTATMTGWFNNAGGASGVGIVLSILFSVMLVAMVLGLYRWYQSKGG